MVAPDLSIVITSYCPESKHYLDLAIESIFRSSYDIKNKAEIILVTRKGYEPRYENVRTVYPEQESFQNPTGINYGVSKTNPKSKFLLLMNDDIIVTKDAIANMVEVLKEDSPVIINPITQSDNFVLYQLLFRFKSKNNVVSLDSRFYKYDDLIKYADDIMESSSVYPSGLVLQQCLYMYFTMMPRKVWDKIGSFDEKFETGHDDLDYCIRAAKEKISLFFALNAFVIHFGGVSSSKTQTDEMRVKGIRYFKEKHGFYPPGMLPEIMDLVKKAEYEESPMRHFSAGDAVRSVSMSKELGNDPQFQRLVVDPAIKDGNQRPQMSAEELRKLTLEANGF